MSGSATRIRYVKDPRAVEPLIAALQDSESEIRGAAAVALGQLQDRRAVRPLITLQNDTIPDVVANAAQALNAITGQNCGTDVIKWRTRWREQRNFLTTKFFTPINYSNHSPWFAKEYADDHFTIQASSFCMS